MRLSRSLQNACTPYSEYHPSEYHPSKPFLLRFFRRLVLRTTHVCKSTNPPPAMRAGVLYPHLG